MRQFDLTPLRLGLAVGGVIAAICLVAIAGAGVGKWGRQTAGDGAQQIAALTQKLVGLEQELRQKELALSVQEKRVKEMQELPTLAAVPPRTSSETPRPGPRAEMSPEGTSPLMQFPGARRDAVAVAPPPTGEDDVEASPGPAKPSASTPKRMTRADRTATERQDATQAKPRQPKPSIINFDAENLTAAAETPNSGILSFRLRKDHPEIRFSGYLFVVLEMADQRGEKKIWAYPDATKIGEEDLPAHYRDGETVAFKSNSRVEVKYNDIRSGATLNRVSILLYGENGEIVFQRGFERKEIQVTVGKRPGTDNNVLSKSGEKRKAL